MKYAIINADDFGLNNSINSAVIQSFQKGVLKSASLLINAEKTQEAVELAKKNPQLDLGIHLCIVQGKPVSKQKNIHSLLDSRGYFFKNHFDFSLKLWRGKINLQEVELEFNAQIKRGREYSLNFTHMDTHQHIHLHPPILRILVRLAKKFEIPWIRYPAETPWPPLASFRNTRNILKSILINTYKRQIMHIFKENDILYPNYIIGMYNDAVLNNRLLKEIFPLVKHGNIIEVIFHPAINNENSPQIHSLVFKHLNREKEFRALMEFSIKHLAVKEHLEFVSFKDIIKNK